MVGRGTFNRHEEFSESFKCVERDATCDKTRAGTGRALAGRSNRWGHAAIARDAIHCNAISGLGEAALLIATGFSAKSRSPRAHTRSHV